MKERAIRVGRPVPLIGVVCEPNKVDVARPAVLIFNSGVMHHIGSCRLSVKLARSFAAKGVLSVRFDFSGVGDSGARRGVKPFSETAPIEAAEIMDYLQEKRGIKQFILYGLCSGADAAYETALVDKRVIAYSQIDAYCYRTPLFYFHYYKDKIFKIKCWVSFIKRVAKKIFIVKSSSEIEGTNKHLEPVSYVRVTPPKLKVQSGLQLLMNRGVYMNIIFTGNEDNYSYRNQFLDSFKSIDFSSYLDLHYLEESTHIVTHPDHQMMTIKIITDWLSSIISNIEDVN